MRKFNLLLSFLFLLGITLVSCEGPMGPAGEDGTNGTNGTDGIDGTNGTAVCQTCHTNDQFLLSKQEQYNNSLHAKGENAAYTNNSSASCTNCHVSQGFRDYIATGTVPTTKYTNPLQPNCYTCHKIHTSFTEADWDLTTTSAVTLTHGSGTYDKGNSNLCANCHQARAVSPMPTVGGADVSLTSSRWGTHHGPVANILAANGGYEVTGTVTYGTNVHGSIADGCITCHMSTPYGNYAGGHQMGLEYDSHGTATPLYTGCTTCHTNDAAFKTKVSDFQASIQTKLDELEALLIADGIYNTATELIFTGTYSADVAGAFLNYQTCKEDRSLGVHNPAYVKALLTNSIEALSVK